MRKLFILGFTLFLTSELVARQTPSDAIKQTIKTMFDAMRKGDSTLVTLSALRTRLFMMSGSFLAALKSTGRC